jgi:hypothetical protein
VLKGEGSDAARRLGKPDSDLFDNLIWIANVYKGFELGMESAFKEANTLKESIDALPDSGIPKELKENTENDFSIVQEITNDNEFVDRTSDLKDAISNIKTLCSDYCQKLLTSENEKIESEINQIKTTNDWSKLNSQQQEEIAKTLNGLAITNKQGLEGIKDILNLNYTITNTFRTVQDQIKEYLVTRPIPTPKPGGGKRVSKDFSKFSKTISNEQQLDKLITELESVRGELNAGNEIEINW